MAGVDVDEQRARDEFATLVLNYLHDELGIDNAVFDPQHFRVTIGDWYCNLNNAFAEFSQCPDEEGKRDTLKRYFHDMRENFSEIGFDQARPLLRASLRDRMQIVAMELDLVDWKTLEDLKNVAREFPLRVIGQHYVCLPALDHESHISYVNEKVLENWVVSFDELMDIATENLRKISREKFVEIADGVFASSWHDSYDSSRILLVDKVKSECQVKGRHLAFLPNRDYVFITGTEDPAGIQMVLEACADVQSMLRPMHMVPLELVQDEWQVFEPEVSHPCYVDLKLRLVSALDGIYRESQSLIEDKLTDEVFLASYTAFQKPENNNIFSTSVWVTTSLLPRTEWITFMRPNQDDENSARMIGIAPWEEVERALGKKFEQTLEYPPRTYVEPFDDTIFSALQVSPDFPALEKVSESDWQSDRPFMDIVGEARERFMRAYLAHIDEHKDDEKCAPEVMFEINEDNQSLIVNVIRVDYYMNEQVVEFRGRSVPVYPTEYTTTYGLKFLLKPISWTQIEFICEKLDRSSPPFVEWCKHWMDVDETFEKDERLLSGSIHSVSIPIATEDFTVLAVDFGSAPLKAFETLLKVLCQTGVKNLVVRTPWNYLI